jgi:hypothetical protein
VNGPGATISGAFATFIAPWAVALVLAASGFIAGRHVIGKLRCTSGLERAMIASALGLGLLGEAAFALASVGRLVWTAILLALAALHLFTRELWPVVFAEARSALRQIRSALRSPGTSLGVVVGALVGVLFFLLPLYPPTAFDATLYHLPAVRAFATSGTMPFLPDLRAPIFPQLGEAVMTIGYLFAGDLASQCLMAIATLLTVGLIALWTRQAFRAPGSGGLSASAFLGNPIVVSLAGAAYIEPLLTLWTTAALYSIHRFRNGHGRAWIALAGAFGGFAASTKYLGLFFLAVGAVIVVMGRMPQGVPRRRIVEGLIYSGVGLAVAGPWYGRITAATGNPLFPFATRLFGASSWEARPVDWGFPASTGPGSSSVFQAFVHFVRLPVDLLTGVERAGLVVPPSPVYLLGLPLLLLGMFRLVPVRRLVLLAAVYAIVLLPLPADVRYLTSVLPLLSVALAGCLAAATANLRPAAWKTSAQLLLSCALLLPGLTYGGYLLTTRGLPPVTPGDRDRYISRALPYYAAIQALNQRLSDHYDLFAYHAENLAYFAQGRFRGDWVGLASFQAMPEPTADPEAVYAAVRRLGADHVLIPNDRELAQTRVRPAFQRRFGLFYCDTSACVFTVQPPAERTTVSAP